MLDSVINSIEGFLLEHLPQFWVRLVFNPVPILLVTVAVILCVAFLTYFERNVLSQVLEIRTDREIEAAQVRTRLNQDGAWLGARHSTTRG